MDVLNFELKPYEWQKEMDVLLRNVNLAKVETSNSKIIYDLINSYDGQPLGRIVCHDVWKIQFDAVELLESPWFVADVRLKKLQGEEIDSAFAYFKCGFDIPKSLDYYLLSFDSGEVSIMLLCGSVELIHNSPSGA